ncbi:MAG: redoxin domain-containing protein [Planctomyces sp.]|nr:redoxin domain-containing protein [Planctomyces sp.]
MKRRRSALIVATLLVFGLSGWRYLNPRQPQSESDLQVAFLKPAPLFELFDQKSRLVKLNAFLNRHPILVVFFDGDKGPDNSEVLRKLRDYYPALKENGVIVLAVSNVLPQQNRSRAEPFPFPLLSDVAGAGSPSVVADWGCAEPADDPEMIRVRNAMFFINQAGYVAWEDKYPKPVDKPLEMITSLLTGSM